MEGQWWICDSILTVTKGASWDLVSGWAAAPHPPWALIGPALANPAVAALARPLSRSGQICDLGTHAHFMRVSETSERGCPSRSSAVFSSSPLPQDLSFMGEGVEIWV